MKIVVLSDTHFMHDELVIPDGDVLVHCGDSLGHGTLEELSELDDFLGRLPHPRKIVIAGNHDWCFERDPEAARKRLTHAAYLQDESLHVGGVHFYGSPWQPWFCDWAFNLERGEALGQVWARIPETTDVLVTHGPPLGYLDRTRSGEQAGCADLLERVKEVKPSLHLYGHIHEGYGTARSESTLFVNASNCTVRYEPLNPPIVLQRVDAAWEVAE